MNIKQVADQFGLTAATLRYYESVGLIPPVRRNENGVRDFTRNDVKWIEFIKCMRDAGLSIEALNEYTALFIKGDHTIGARKNILLNEREKLIGKRNEYDHLIKKLDRKINDYNGKLLENEMKLRRQPTAETSHEISSK
ncbi:MerR family transcriptional regulator [Paenibacillus sp. HN-1]|uniref:MerR family transcriptional regulator n=1 Tax=Paenibacillus TaxID=44249 RepID=UPI001CAA0B9E|nr:MULTISPECIES: MerR family transcriptional regulator [Paenibacillus]MBY9078137.1 MerR family transcriptional regulator [Paenibacillus sp. CGMCC 1.18879]MBY9083878.1 MerR family transcriptional regulator [Paenibacillus sinensis]